MEYYPIFVDMRGRKVLLVGGGHVALEKIGKLVEAGAQVTVVAPDLIPQVQAFVDDGRVTLQQRRYESGDVEGFDVVFVATDDGGVNSFVADEARDQPVAEVGNRQQPLAAVVDDQPGIPPEARMPARKLDAGHELELADAGDLGVARVQLDRLGGQAKRLGRCWKRQEQCYDENAPGAQGEAPAAWRLTFSAIRFIARSRMPS